MLARAVYTSVARQETSTDVDRLTKQEQSESDRRDHFPRITVSMRRFPDVIKLDFVADSEDGELRKHRFRVRGKPVKHPKSQMFAPVSGSRIAAGFEDRLRNPTRSKQFPPPLHRRRMHNEASFRIMRFSVCKRLSDKYLKSRAYTSDVIVRSYMQRVSINKSGFTSRREIFSRVCRVN